MIKTTLQITNPFAKDSFKQASWFKVGKLTKNKSWELQVWKGSVYELLKLELDLAWRGHDHAGPNLSVGVLGIEITIKIYDNRHWDYEKGTWQTYV